MSVEGFKMVAQFVRLLISLSTGAVLVVGALLRDVFPQPQLGTLLGLSLGSFAICVLCCLGFSLRVAALVFFYENYDPSLDPLPSPKSGDWLWRTALVSFFLGFVLFSVFVLWNLPV